MQWLIDLIFTQGTAHTILVLSLVISIGFILGRWKVAGVSIGSAWILFVGIIVSHFGLRVDGHTIHFFKELGLVLFVFSIGLQVGPGFLSALKRGGLKLNLLAVTGVAISVLTTIALYFATGLPGPVMVGIMSGAVTNTPGLGAAQEAFRGLTGMNNPNIAAGYAMAYPLAVVGIIFSIQILRVALRINVDVEARRAREASGVSANAARRLAVTVANPKLFGRTVGEIKELVSTDFVVSRIWYSTEDSIALVDAKTVLNEGDHLLIVAHKKDHNFLETLIGPKVEVPEEHWLHSGDRSDYRQVLLTRSKLNGIRLGELSLRSLHGVSVTRVHRTGTDLVASPRLRLLMGDRLTIVGAVHDIKRAEKLLGNSTRRLEAPNLIVVFIGIALGVIVGSIPFEVPGVPQPLQLGLAGGPLIVALILGRIGPRLHLVTYSTMSANLMLREIGMALFLAGVGLSAGETFVDTVVGGGYWWILWGFIITIVPMLTMGLLGRLWLKINYLTLAGMMAGASTDPPALAFAQSITDSDAPSVGYATVYPVTMFLRVLAAQVLVIMLV